MGKKKLIKRTRIKPFIRTINYNHLMPTRYDFFFFFSFLDELQKYIIKLRKNLPN
jgi:hypothetical protein